MKITNCKTFHLTEKELKEAITDWVANRFSFDDQYFKILNHNKAIIEINSNGTISIMIDGEFEEYNSEKK